MREEVIPGLYLCQLKTGTVYYLVNSQLYDQIHTEVNGQDARVNYAAMAKELEIKHLLHGGAYMCPFHKIKIVNWDDLSKTYRMDALALHEGIREKRGKVFKHIKPEEVTDLRTKLFGVVDKVTNTLKYYKWSGGIKTETGAAMLYEVSHPSHANEALVGIGHGSLGVAQPIMPVYSLQEMRGEYKPINTQQTNNNIMDFSNIPGMNLSFGLLEKGRMALSMSGEVAYRNKDNEYIIIRKDGTENTRVDVGNMKLDIDFYKLPTQELEVGDVILLGNELLIVDSKRNGDTKFINPLTGSTTNKLQRDNILGMYFYSKIVSIFDMGGKKDGIGLGGLDPMTLMLLTQSGGQNSFGGGDLGQFLVLSQLTKGGNEINPMLLMSMLGGNKGGENTNQLTQFMLMSQVMGGGKGFGGLFGAKKKAAARPAPTKQMAKGGKPRGNGPVKPGTTTKPRSTKGDRG